MDFREDLFSSTSVNKARREAGAGAPGPLFESRAFLLVASSAQVQGTKVNVRFVDPGCSQATSSLPAACRKSVLIPSGTRGTARLMEPRYGG